MSNQQAKVALFIDWDNLAISTAADLGGATPDVRAIVQRAQQFGTLIVAKAFAEWQASSDRLAVYRAGIEPAYAPTFRFEPDSATQQGKGKSLADPCMVADCIDALHLFPDIGVYVLVTGDKDLIPVVRLAQMRGRKVVVIGPDYVAGVLREMADEFIPYRSLVEGAPARPEPVRRYAVSHVPSEEHLRRRDRQPSPASFARHERTSPSTLAQTTTPPERPAARPEMPEAPAEPAEELQPNLTGVFGLIVDIMRQRRAEGRDRVRATNLKDSLMQRLPGFSERKYGFAKFKDLLVSAERSGLISLTAAGPVHWISLPTVEEAAVATTSAEPEPLTPEDAGAGAAPQPSESDHSDMIRFVFDLRHRSRWLTYTYVLTNLISHFARSLPQSAAEAQARATLNYLVQEGILQVDREPQEVEVGGARHRVRMCHINAEHPLVIETLGSSAEEELREGSEPSEPQAVELAQSSNEPTEMVTETASSMIPEPEGGVTGLASTVPQPEQLAVQSPSDNGALDHGEAPDNRRAHGRGRGRFQRRPDTTSSQSQPPSTETEVPISQAEANAEPGATDTVQGEALGLDHVFGVLGKVVREAAAKDKRMLSGSTIRTRLSEALGSFSERDFGFTRFKDFLTAAQEAGVIRIQVRGHVTLVAPVDGAEGVPPSRS